MFFEYVLWFLFVLGVLILKIFKFKGLFINEILLLLFEYEIGLVRKVILFLC